MLEGLNYTGSPGNSLCLDSNNSNNINNKNARAKGVEGEQGEKKAEE